MKIKLELIELLNEVIKACTMNFDHVKNYSNYTFWHKNFNTNKCRFELEILADNYFGGIYYNNTKVFTGSGKSFYSLFLDLAQQVFFLKSN